jgi:hypothetical protein
MTPFYLCTNPAVVMPPEVDGCVYAFKKPRFFAMVERLGQAKPVSELSYAGVNVIFSYGLNGEKPVDYIMAVSDNIDGAPYGKLHKKLMKAVEWYVQVRGLEVGAKRVDFSMLQDYTPQVPCMQAVRFMQTGEYLLSYGFGVKGFTSMEAVEAFMREQLKLPETAIENGVVNTDEID